MTPPDTNSYSITLSGFPVVGVGASAGGLEAFKTMISAIPADVNMAFVLVQHLMPNKKSMLHEILSRATVLPVVPINEQLKIEVNHIYVIQPNTVVTVSDGYLHVSPRPADRTENKPADILFNSLALAYEADAAAVILSGTGEDGTEGLRSISERGGITIAQDNSAVYGDMPRHAIAANVIDFILPPEQIVAKLTEFYTSLRLNFQDTEPVSVSRDEEETYLKILALVRHRVGVDFSLYKQTTVRRRIVRRMLMLKAHDIFSYSDYVHQHPLELEHLFYDLIIPVTSFFRDEPAFELLVQQVVPEIVKQKNTNEPLRIWVAACSTGQEPYSIAMALHELFNDELNAERIQIFATDVSERAIKKARSGQYLRKELESLNPALLAKYFDKKQEYYVVKKYIRDRCVFATHNFLKDPPFAKMDLISCRNVMIYLKPFLQKKALGTFHYALRDRGILWLGKSETAGPASALFQVLDQKNKFYVRKAVAAKYVPRHVEGKQLAVNQNHDMLRHKELKTDDYQKSVEDLLLARYTPASVIVNDQFDIVQFRGSTGKFLEPQPGKASLNLMKMAKEGLSFELRNALHRCRSSREPFRKEGIAINQGQTLVNIEVAPILNTIDPHYLVLFWEQKQIAGPRRISAKNKQSADEARIMQLEQELSQLREDMRSITEDQEITNEELQSSNEELLSGSEELQSLNEELETSKEELQSANEELLTVNQELLESNEELNASRRLAEAIIATLHEPLVILAKDFTVIDVNKAFCLAFNVDEEQSIGSSFFDLQHGEWNIERLHQELSRISERHNEGIAFELGIKFSSLGDRIIKFNIHTVNKLNGEPIFVLALDDVTAGKNFIHEQKVFAAELQRQIADKIRLERQKNDFISMASHELKTPVTSIKGYTQALRSRFRKEGHHVAEEFLNKMDKQINKLTNLIGDLLDATKVTAGQLQYNLETFAFNELVQEIVDEMQQTSNKHTIKLTLDAPVHVYGDRNRIGQVITNLLSNAIKYSPKANEVMISTTVNPHEVVLSVQDFGIGIAAAYQKSVFEQFFRAEGFLQKTFSGLGFGLFIASEIIKRHSGQIGVVSEEAKGSTFSFTLPIQPNLEI